MIRYTSANFRWDYTFIAILSMIAYGCSYLSLALFINTITWERILTDPPIIAFPVLIFFGIKALHSLGLIITLFTDITELLRLFSYLLSIIDGFISIGLFIAFFFVQDYGTMVNAAYLALTAFFSAASMFGGYKLAYSIYRKGDYATLKR